MSSAVFSRSRLNPRLVVPGFIFLMLAISAWELNASPTPSFDDAQIAMIRANS